MAIRKVKINGEEHELQTTIANVDGLNDILNTTARLDPTDNENIEDASGGASAHAVLYTPQTLTEAQQAQARANIGVSEGGGTYVTPQMFGAKGDGVTDDTNAINNALTSSMNKNVQIYFPAGTYIVTAPLTLPDGIVVKGDGTKSIIKTNFANGYVLQGTSSTTITGVSIVDMTFQNIYPADPTTKLQQGNFVYCANAIYMNNCRVKYYAKVFEELKLNTYLYNNHFTAIYEQFARIVTDSVINGNYINSSRYGLLYNSKAFTKSINSTSFQNNLIDYFYDVFAVSSGESATITNNTFNRCVNVFHDYIQNFVVCNNLFTRFGASHVDLTDISNMVPAERISALQNEKWSLIKFDGKVNARDNHLIATVIFANNIGRYVDNYICIADGVKVIAAECSFEGNRIVSGMANGIQSGIDVGFRNETKTETAYNSFKDVYFDFLDMKTWDTLPNPSLYGENAKSVKSFPYMKAIYNNEVYVNINGAWRMYAPPVYDGGIA